MTTPDTADWHASEEGQEERRQVATHDRDALSQFVNPFKACELLDREMFDGVPGIKVVPLGSGVGELEGTTQRKARDAWANREGITWWPEARDAELARQHREGLHSGPARSRLTDAKHPEITTALCTAPRPMLTAFAHRVCGMCLRDLCRIEPYIDQAAPLRGAAPGAPRARLCLGRPAGRARAGPASSSTALQVRRPGVFAAVADCHPPRSLVPALAGHPRSAKLASELPALGHDKARGAG